MRGQRPQLGQCLSTSGTIPHSAVVHGRVPLTKKDASSTQSLLRLNVGMWPSKKLEYAERKVNFGAFSKSFGILPVQRVSYSVSSFSSDNLLNALGMGPLLLSCLDVVWLYHPKLLQLLLQPQRLPENIQHKNESKSN